MSRYLNRIDPSAPCETMPPKLAMEIPFALDPFQQHAIAAISRDENVLVTAKTGSGKTLVGEYQIAHSLAKGKRVFYTTPIKSLSNQKFYDLKRMFPSVGIMTGDLKFRPDADVVIMTTEILRNLLFKQGSAATQSLGITANLSLDRLDAVVFDECHYINDRDRGAVWEETMVLLPREVNLVLLSATIDAPELFAGWLGDLKEKPIHLISTTYRIVPLQHAVYKDEQLVCIMDNRETFEGGLYTGWLRWRQGLGKAADDHKARVADRRRGGWEDAPVARETRMKAYRHQMNELIGRLEEKELLPALFFVFSRKDCERYAAATEHTLLDSSDVASVKHIVDFHLHRYGEELQRIPQYTQLRSLLERGIAFHHSGLLPVLKEMVEVLFGRGLVKLLFATETFAVGINMPTKTVVFTGYRKYDDATGGMRMLNTDEYIQMAGRAGRRGKDDRGLVLYLPDREAESMEDVKRMMTGARATFQSRMTFHYDFLLKTLQGGSLSWREFLQRSYWYRRHMLTVAAVQRDLEKAQKGVEALAITPLECSELEERERLAAALKGAVNAARREAQKAWSVWENRHVGPRWANLAKDVWPKRKALLAEIDTLQRELVAMEEPAADVWPSFVALGRMGLLVEPVSVEEGLTLTATGTAATEINEGHPILEAIAFRDRLLHSLSAEGILACLAAFMEEGKEDTLTLEGLQVQTEVITALRAVEALARTAERTEQEVGAARPPSDRYWQLKLSWVEPIWRWLAEEGVTAVTLCTDYGVYEGNLMRVLMKMVNLLEEWRSLATLATDVEMLEKLHGMEQRLLRGVAVCDSLYLRL